MFAHRVVVSEPWHVVTGPASLEEKTPPIN
jgi:hypothetical protein